MNPENEKKEGFDTQTTCPLCHNEMIIHWQSDDIPFFGEVMYVTSRCECGFRFTDTMILAQKEPIRCELKIEKEEDLNCRVIRSISGTIRIPELGIVVEPGNVSDSYVTNVEGLLFRVRDVVETAIKWSEDDPEKEAAGKKILERLNDTLSSKANLTVIMEDPLGNSTIISERASCSNLTPEEASALKTGMVILNADSADLKVDSSENIQPLGNDYK
ncbi:ZPR1 zinc finger domain-containing protein [Methanohalophilus mahii]|uniref:ZPR1-related zinc finger protein n=1 Tax=Methanohalophilus mahii (strain ATCC 35705 / DSM 5219 / SLP) TaxID=547558 RepID=D5EAV8_METMS|nr:ZPR1 zinc finger domain-containing protein [Methanohalophilus mahii]ADE36309.1 ZPR1-related zinc finger protein [Methanohalophilus mahii DSM 5219]